MREREHKLHLDLDIFKINVKPEIVWDGGNEDLGHLIE